MASTGMAGYCRSLDGGEAFALSPTSVNEAGCIHTTQGLEFEYVGVIVGDDLRCEGGRLVTDYTRRARADQSIRGLKKMEREDPSVRAPSPTRSSGTPTGP